MDPVIAECQPDLGIETSSACPKIRFAASIIIAKAHNIAPLEFCDAGVEDQFRRIGYVTFAQNWIAFTAPDCGAFLKIHCLIPNLP